MYFLAESWSGCWSNVRKINIGFLVIVLRSERGLAMKGDIQLGVMITIIAYALELDHFVDV